MRRFRLRAAIGHFLRDQGGTAIVEGMVFAPVMVAAWIGSFAFWEVFDAKARLEKATFVATDLLARETVALRQADIDGVEAIIARLIGARNDVSTRFTSYKRTGTGDADVTVTWSKTTDATAFTALTTADLRATATSLPVLKQGSGAVMVETRMAYRSPFPIPFLDWVAPTSFSDRMILRSRFVPSLCFVESDGSTTC